MSRAYFVCKDNHAYLQATNPVYATAHDGANGVVHGSSPQLNIIVGQSFAVGNYNVYRGALYFDTSVIGNGASVIVCQLVLYFIAAGGEITVVKPTDLDEPTVQSDFGQLLDEITSLGSLAISGAGIDNISCNDLAPYVDITGTTKVALRTQDDINSVTPAPGDTVIFYSYDLDEASPSNFVPMSPGGGVGSDVVVSDLSATGFTVTVVLDYNLAEYMPPILILDTDEVVADYSNVDMRFRWNKADDWGVGDNYTDWIIGVPLGEDSIETDIVGAMDENETYRVQVQFRVNTDTYMMQLYKTFNSGTFATVYPSEGTTRVSGLIHRFSPGNYKLEAVLGGLSSSFSVPGSSGRVSPAVNPTPPPVKSTYTQADYESWLRSHSMDIILAIFGHFPTFDEWLAWYIVYGRGFSF